MSAFWQDPSNPAVIAPKYEQFVSELAEAYVRAPGGIPRVFTDFLRVRMNVASNLHSRAYRDLVTYDVSYGVLKRKPGAHQRSENPEDYYEIGRNRPYGFDPDRLKALKLREKISRARVDFLARMMSDIMSRREFQNYVNFTFGL